MSGKKVWTDHPIEDLAFHARTSTWVRDDVPGDLPAYLDFEVFEVDDYDEDAGLPLYNDRRRGFTEEKTTDVWNTSSFCSGCIKFDGSARITLIVDGWGPDDLAKISPMFDRLYALAIGAMPHAREYLEKRDVKS